MTVQAVLAPLFVQVLLTFALLVLTGRGRFAAVRRGETRIGQIALGEPNWPARVQATGNAFSNQFELPVLFYVLVPLALITRKADLLFVVLAWLFVLTRIAHAGVFVTSNHVPTRFYAYMAGVLVLAAMWIVFALRILLAPVLP